MIKLGLFALICGHKNYFWSLLVLSVTLFHTTKKLVVWRFHWMYKLGLFVSDIGS